MQELEIIQGTIEKFLFQNADNFFSIFILQNGQTTITVKGYLPSIAVGQEVQLKGEWVFHAKFGKQFNAQECISILPTTLVGLKRYLGSGLIKGIGPTFANKLVNHFGNSILDIIDKNPERLKEINGIGPKKIEKISLAWKDQKEISNLMVFLQEKNISPSLATRIYKKYKGDAVSILLENPYKIAEDIWGIGFKTADEIAQKLGFAYDAPERITSGILHVISQATGQGNLYVELEDLKAKTVILLGLNIQEHSELLKNALLMLYNNEKIKYVSKNDCHYITLSSYYFTEEGLSNKIKTLLSSPTYFKFNIDKIYQRLRLNTEIELHENQQCGIISCLQNKITIITGGPGTGKTTLIKQLLSILEDHKLSYKLSAPTGRAAKRITEGTGKYATTIHRLLEFDVSTMRFTYNEKNALKLDFLIIDEASMIDTFLAYAILKAIPLHAHLVFIGDIDQLPSVGPGNILNDLITSKKISCIKLTHIFRQAQNSLIVVNAHRINSGQLPITQTAFKKDFFFIKEEDPKKVISHLKRILFVELKKHNISIDDTVVLTPMNRSIIGTYALNNLLQEILNPDAKQHVNYTTTKFKINDKVMQIKNNYDKHVYNGDIGIIDKIDHEEKEVIVNFDKHFVTYDFDELNELVLAYAISIHKSQGSEYNAVIVPIFMQHFMLLQKNLIYTALTRAKKLCIFLGQPKALALAIKNNKGTGRLTFLKDFLTGEILE